MNMHKTNIPGTSMLIHLPRDYADSYSAVLAKAVTIDQVGKSFFASGPAWVDALFILRNKMVGLVGLKTADVGDKETVLKNFSCEVGESLGLFQVLAKNEREIVFGQADKHLDFRLSLFLDKPNRALYLSTIVILHNWMGRLYFLPVRFFHKIIVPTMGQGMVRELERD